MHENGIVRNLMKRVEQEAGGSLDRVEALSFRVGVMSGIRAEVLREAVHRYTVEHWSHNPRIEVDRTEDATEPGAMGVRLVSVRLEED